MLSLLQKLDIVIRTVKNWYVIPIDKLGINHENIYEFGSNKLICRSKTTDINEACVIFSGHEYPPLFMDIPRNSIVFDLGVNIGAFIVYLSSLNRGKEITGYGFEPWKENFDISKRNLELNQIENFSIFQEAISGEDGIMNFNVDCGFDAGALVTDTSNTSDKCIKVSTRSLESFCKDNGITSIDLLKMDIEGGEYLLFEKESLFISKTVKTILMEYHNLDKINNLDKIMQYLSKDFDATIYHSDNGGGNIFAKIKSN